MEKDTHGATESRPRSRVLEGQDGSNGEGIGTNLLLSILFKTVHDGPVRGLGKTAFDSGFLVMLKALAEPLWTIVKGITKRLMCGLENVSAGHEHLKGRRVSQIWDFQEERSSKLFRVGAAPMRARHLRVSRCHLALLPQRR